MYGLTTYVIFIGIEEHLGYLKDHGTAEDHDYGLKVYDTWMTLAYF